MFTETWLHNNVNSSELGLSDYSVYRCDRSIVTSSLSRGGGVLIAVNNKYISCSLDVDVKSLELCFVSIKINSHKKLIISCVYIPPNSTSSLYIDYFNILENLISAHPNAEFLNFGDFNLPNLSKATLNLDLNIFSTENIFLEHLALLNLFQLNTITNTNGSILDLILSNSSSPIVSLNTDSIVPIDSYHPPLNVCHFFNHLPPDLSYFELSFDWFNGNYNSIISFLGSINWAEFYKISSDISVLVDEFYSLLFFTINSFIPKKKHFNPKYPNWFSNELKNLITQKRKFHKYFKISNSSSDYLHFSSLRSQCKIQSKLDYKQYLCNVQHSLSSEPKKFWSFVRNLRSPSGLPHSITFNHKTADYGLGIVNLFNRYFASVYKKTSIPNHNNSVSVNSSFGTITNFHINQLEVFYELDCLNSKAIIGCDGLSPIFLYACRFILSPPITYIFNSSLNSGCFPIQWKSSFITPIFKKGNRSLASNYRPISIISILPKMFSKIINSKLTPLFKNILATQQHGFRSKKSTETNLICFKEYILNSFSKGKQTDVIYTDFEKAFDRVDHQLLIFKLSQIGIADPLLSWINSFLIQRTQYVKYKNFISDPISVISGVPQGDHLSPLLFNLFINDIVLVIKNSNILLFADDAKIFKSIDTPEDTSLLQQDLNNFNDWCFNNGLSLNVDKCQIITFSKKHIPITCNYYLSNISLSRSSLVNDLGILFDSKLIFNSHIISVKKKALSIFGMVKRNCSEFFNPLTFKQLYISLIRSQLEYATIIWVSDSIGHSNDIEIIQNKVLRFICFKCNIPRIPHSGYNNILTLLNLQSLKDRRHNYYASFLNKLINNNIDDSFILNLINFKVNPHNTRNSDLFYIPNKNKNYLACSPLNILMSNGNNLSNVILFV